MLGGARTRASEVAAHGTGEQFGCPFLAFGGRHRRLAGARLWRGWTDQVECSRLGMVGSGPLPDISPAVSRFHESSVSHVKARDDTVCQWP